MALSHLISGTALAVSAFCATLTFTEPNPLSAEKAVQSITKAGYTLVKPMERHPAYFVATVRDDTDPSVRHVKVYRDGRVVGGMEPAEAYELGKNTFKALVQDNS